MADVQLPSEVLVSLVRVLERVEERLEKLDKHFDHTQSLYTLDTARKLGLSQSHLEYDEPVLSNSASRESPQTQDSARLLLPKFDIVTGARIRAGYNSRQKARRCFKDILVITGRFPTTINCQLLSRT